VNTRKQKHGNLKKSGKSKKSAKNKMSKKSRKNRSARSTMMSPWICLDQTDLARSRYNRIGYNWRCEQGFMVASGGCIL
jgi:hypothetical protein